MHDHTTAEAIYPFDARGIARRFRHSAIFGALDALHPGETMRFMNDHDPLPLLSQIEMRYGDGVAIEYRQREQRRGMHDRACGDQRTARDDAGARAQPVAHGFPERKDRTRTVTDPITAAFARTGDRCR